MNMENEQVKSPNLRAHHDYRRKKSAKEMQFQVITFALMIFLTIVSFIAVGTGDLSVKFIIPFILLLAVIQVGFQLYYFMHASQKGHELPMLFMYFAMIIAFVTILAFATIIWW